MVEAPAAAPAEAAAETQHQGEPLPARRWVVVRRRAKDRPEGAEAEAQLVETDAKPPEGGATPMPAPATEPSPQGS
jgi:hypothetical protein